MCTQRWLRIPQCIWYTNKYINCSCSFSVFFANNHQFIGYLDLIIALEHIVELWIKIAKFKENKSNASEVETYLICLCFQRISTHIDAQFCSFFCLFVSFFFHSKWWLSSFRAKSVPFHYDFYWSSLDLKKS